ncbi:MAG: ROK family protein [Verrucomicrobia bacterium]|nr:ROK family protein [Verrucomicrobiota bacterium]
MAAVRRVAIGIDIGGTKMAVANVDQHGSIVAREILPTEAELGFPRAVERLIAAAERVFAAIGKNRPRLCGLGIACAGPVAPPQGLINNPYTLAGWSGCDIVTPLQEHFAAPAYLENDADMAALGECHCGAGRDCDPVVMLTFGTGVGGAVVMRNEVYRGVQGEHPELGHMAISADGPKCYCGTSGCLESLASGTAIAEAGRGAGFEDARQVFSAAREGHAAARAIVERAVNAAASAAWTICHTFLPQRLILGGGMMDEHFDLFAAAINARLKSPTQFKREAFSVERAKLGNDAGLVGAAHAAFLRNPNPPPAREVDLAKRMTWRPAFPYAEARGRDR